MESHNRQDITFDPYCIMVGLQLKNVWKVSLLLKFKVQFFAENNAVF